MDEKIAQRQSIVTIEGIEGRWATKSGGNISADVTAVWDGGEDEPSQLAGPATAENVTVSRPIGRIRYLSIIPRLKRQVGKLRATITVQTTDAMGFPIGEPSVYPQALLVTMNEPEVDAGSGDAQVLELEWAISKYV